MSRQPNPTSSSPKQSSQHGADSPPPPSRVFFLTINGTKHELNARYLRKSSQRCQKLINDGTYEYVIEKPYDSETATAFLKACQYKPFAMTPDIAFNLLDLSEEWECEKLTNSVKQFIAQKGLQQSSESEEEPEFDIIDRLLKHIEEEIDDPNDIDELAPILSAHLDDPRILQIPPDILFQLVLAAKPDMSLLIEFVMKLFDTAPNSAVPLVLLLDFDAMTEDQRDKVFGCREMHQHRLNYFIAVALSSAENEAANEMKRVHDRHQAEIAEMDQRYNSLVEGVNQKFKDTTESMIADLTRTISDQNDEIQELSERLEAQRTKIQQFGTSSKERVRTLTQDVSKVEGDSAVVGTSANSRAAECVTDIKEKANQLQAAVEEEMSEAIVFNEETFDKTEADEEQRRVNMEVTLEQFEQNLEEVEKKIEIARSRTRGIRSALVAKTIRDRLRYDSYIRKTSNRFDAIDVDQWDVNIEDVRNAEEIIISAENKILENCPIRQQKSATARK